MRWMWLKLLVLSVFRMLKLVSEYFFFVIWGSELFWLGCWWWLVFCIVLDCCCCEFCDWCCCCIWGCIVEVCWMGLVLGLVIGGGMVCWFKVGGVCELVWLLLVVVMLFWGGLVRWLVVLFEEDWVVLVLGLVLLGLGLEVVLLRIMGLSCCDCFWFCCCWVLLVVVGCFCGGEVGMKGEMFGVGMVLGLRDVMEGGMLVLRWLELDSSLDCFFLLLSEELICCCDCEGDWVLVWEGDCFWWLVLLFRWWWWKKLVLVGVLGFLGFWVFVGLFFVCFFLRKFSVGMRNDWGVWVRGMGEEREWKWSLRRWDGKGGKIRVRGMGLMGGWMNDFKGLWWWWLLLVVGSGSKEWVVFVSEVEVG